MKKILKKDQKNVDSKKRRLKVGFEILVFFLVIVAGFQYYHTYSYNTYSHRDILKPYLNELILSPLFLRQVSENEVILNLDNKRKAVFTFLPHLQKAGFEIFQKYNAPLGAFVAIEPSTGAVLAMVGQGDNYANKDFHLTLSSGYPAASIFKIVTLAACLEYGTIKPSELLQATGRLRCGDKYIRDSSNVPSGSITVTNALAKSCNTAFAKIALDLGAIPLKEYAFKFGFNSNLNFEMPVEISSAIIDNEPFSVAASGAGFGSINMSPLHGALIAATIANQGKMMSPYMIKKIVDKKGNALMEYRPYEAKAPILSSTAEIIKEMMIQTVHGDGNAHKSFYDKGGRPYLPWIKVAGKTGSLSNGNLNYTWFVGFAPVDNPQIAIAVMIGNYNTWKAKAGVVARELLKAYFNNNINEVSYHHND
ncbi:hypothetical protein KJ997_06220 [bacterium]|nr:hypothetical protein [bacterium]